MEEQILKDIYNGRQDKSSYQLMLDYENYLKERKYFTNQKTIFHYKETKLALTPRQVEVLKLIAMGFSNVTIASILTTKEATIKLFVYRLMKYLEAVLYESIDRFYLVIIAQQLDLERGS